jgi:hypothetical protein
MVLGRDREHLSEGDQVGLCLCRLALATSPLYMLNRTQCSAARFLANNSKSLVPNSSVCKHGCSVAPKAGLGRHLVATCQMF